MGKKKAILQAVESAKTEPWMEAQDTLPEGWRLDGSGVAKDTRNSKEIEEREVPKWVKISGPIWVAGFTRDYAGGGWGAVLKWIDRDNAVHERAVPAGRFHEQGPALAQELAGEGLRIIPGKERQLLSYLGAFDHILRIRSVAHLGWLDTTTGALAYVLPGEVITKGKSETIVFQPERHAPTTATIKAEGSLADWQTHVAEPCRGNDLLVFGTCCGLAGPLAKPAGMDSGGFHEYGRTTGGKTTQLQVSASIFGCGADPAYAGDLSLIRRWNTTSNGAEGLAAAHNDAPLLLDEIGTCAAKDFGALIYNVAGGQGKVAMDSARNLKPARSWRVLILSTGEYSSRQKIEEAGKGVKGGQLLRLIDIPIPEGGIITDPHGMAPDKFADTLKRACGTYYGTAGPAFIRKLVEQSNDANDFRNTVQKLVDNATDFLTPPAAPPEQRRAIKRFALVQAAGLMAVRFGILPFSETEIIQAVKAARNLWLASMQGEATDAERGIASIREFILRHESRFRHVGDSKIPVRDLAGYLDADRGLYLFTQSGFSEACSGNNPKEVVQELARRDWLFINERDRYLSRHSVAGISGQIRLYAVKSAVLGGGHDE